jgi:hypothetical protein
MQAVCAGRGEARRGAAGRPLLQAAAGRCRPSRNDAEGAEETAASESTSERHRAHTHKHNQSPYTGVKVHIIAAYFKLRDAATTNATQRSLRTRSAAPRTCMNRSASRL